MKAGFLQYSPVFCDPEKNLMKLSGALDKAPDCDLLVLPELCDSGYNLASREQAMALSEDAHKGGSSIFWKDIAVKRIHGSLRASMSVQEVHSLIRLSW